jgi:gentisate 1,2-dioxygenase
VFSEHRCRAFDQSAETGFIALDQSAQLGCPWAATTPTMLARYIVLRAGERHAHSLHASGLVYHVIRGEGSANCGSDAFDWAARDAFCMPGGEEISLTSPGGAILMVFSDEPIFSYLGAAANPEPAMRVEPTHFSFARIEESLQEVHAHQGEQLNAGKAVLLVTDAMADRKLATPGLLASYNSLEPGGDQRAHKHSSAALTLSIAGNGVHSTVDGQIVPWEPDTLIVTPPYAVHAHHNRGERMMLSFVVQDTALFTEMRALSFQWTE